MIRVLYLFGSLALGGAERNIVALLPHLAANDVEPVFCTLDNSRDSFLLDELVSSGCERIDLGARKLLDARAAYRLRRLLSELRIDVLHAQDQYAAILGGVASRGSTASFVLTRHVLGEPQISSKDKIRAYLLHLSARRWADAVIAVSEAVGARLAAAANLPRRKVCVIHNGIDVRGFEAGLAKAGARAELEWSIDRPTVVLIGVLREGKGHDLLLEALPALLQRVPDVQVKFVGPGALDPATAATARLYGEVVDLVGPRDDIPRVLRAADLLVQASWAEGLPTVLIEAAAAGLPVVATDVGGTRDIVDDGVTGWIVPAGDAALLAERIADLLQNPPAAARMGEHARRTVTQRFSLPRQARQTAAVYQSLRSSARRSSAPSVGTDDPEAPHA